MAHTLVLIDGHALAYRMFYTLPVGGFTTKEGEPTNATYGFARTLLDLILADDPPHYVTANSDVRIIRAGLLVTRGQGHTHGC